MTGTAAIKTSGQLGAKCKALPGCGSGFKWMMASSQAVKTVGLCHKWLFIPHE